MKNFFWIKKLKIKNTVWKGGRYLFYYILNIIKKENSFFFFILSLFWNKKMKSLFQKFKNEIKR